MAATAIKSKWSSGNLTFYESVTGNDAVLSFGEDDTGLDVKMFGATSGAFWLWDQSADTVVRDGGTVFVQAVASGDGGITVSADGMTADPETAAEAGYITVKVGSTSYQVPMYAA